MTRRLITLIFAACLLASPPACGGARKAQDAKQPAGGDVNQNKLEEGILGLRNLLYSDKPLEESLDLVGKDDPVSGAAAAVRAKDYGRALDALRGLKGRGDSAEDLPYWLTLAAAQRGAGNTEEAKAAARHLLTSSETRTRIQAWTVLRELGEAPPAKQADEVLGVIVEISLNEGVVIIAGYSDGAARYFFSRGGGVIGEDMPESVKQAAKALTQTAAPLAGTMDAGVRQGLPARTHIRVSLLTPSGIRVAEVADGRAEDPSHPLHAVYIAAYKLFEELQKMHKEK